MDPKLKEIIDGLPDKPPRSRLQPYYEFITELRRRGRTYRDIAQVLAEKCQLQVTASGVHDFVRTRSKAKRRPGGRSNSRKGEQRVLSSAPRIKTAVQDRVLAPTPDDEVARKIATLKGRKVDAKRISDRFHFDVNEPLRLTKAEKKQ